MSGSGPAAPAGFRALAMGEGFMGVNGPLWLRHEGALVQIGFRVEPRHCNPMGNCHGGMLASFSDMVLPLSIHRKAPPGSPLAPKNSPGYTLGMKTAISIPDQVYSEAERLSRRLKKSRSQVYTEAVTEYIARHDPDAVTEAMNRVCEVVDTRPDPALANAARRTLEAVEW